MSAGRTTQELVRDWLGAQQNVERARSALNRAECDLANTIIVLGKHLAPSDIADGESVSIWVRLNESQERLLVVKRDARGRSDYEIGFRGAPRGGEVEG